MWEEAEVLPPLEVAVVARFVAGEGSGSQISFTTVSIWKLLDLRRSGKSIILLTVCTCNSMGKNKSWDKCPLN